VTDTDARTAVYAEPLAPVRAALLARAHADAARMLAEADADAERVLDEAGTQARELRARARSEGEADAEAVASATRARARRDARATVLRARREAYRELRRRVLEAVPRLRDDPAYPELRDQLVSRARATLGPEATIVEDPAGGIVARSGRRRAAFTLTALAGHVLDQLDLEGLWSA
jgi:vacuolar-type H+-ATPase subunit E/Vma4